MAPTTDDIVGLDMVTRGRVVVPENAVEYDRCLKKNHSVGFHSNRPLLFVNCHDAGDIRLALEFVQRHHLPVSVRSGGHSVCGSSLKTGTVVIDVGAMNSVSYDPLTDQVTFGPGAMLSDINVSLFREGRMTPNGVVPHTGAGGLASHGGTGWLHHRFGTTCDNITKMSFMTADGVEHHLGMESTGGDRELFFAARGCAGGLGIVTSFTCRTYPMETITGGFWIMVDDDQYTRTRELMRRARDLVEEEDASPEKTHRTFIGGVYPMNMPPEPSVPEELHGKPVTACWVGAWGGDAGAMAICESFLDRPIAFGKPPAVMPYHIFNSLACGLFLAFPPFDTYWKAGFVDTLPDQLIDEFVAEWATHEPWLNAGVVGVDFMGGKAGAEHGRKLQLQGDNDNDHSVQHLRKARYVLPILLYFPPGQDDFRAKARELGRSLYAIGSKGSSMMYSNYCSTVTETEDEKKDATERLYDSSAKGSLARIQTVKSRVDPNNLFTRSVLPSV